MSGDPPNSLHPEPENHPSGDELDRPWLSYIPSGSLGSRWKNWRLEGAGFSPFMIYGSIAGVIALWFLGACLLSFLGPIFLLVLVAGLLALTGYVSKRAALSEKRVAQGLCPGCGYDLRATENTCPECGDPVPEEILRRRRNMDRIRILQGGATIFHAEPPPNPELPAAMRVPARLPPPVDHAPIPLEEAPAKRDESKGADSPTDH